MGMSLAFFKAKSGGPLDWLINQTTGRLGYSHVELVFSDNSSFCSSPKYWGCRFDKIDFNDGDWDLIPVPTTCEDESVIRAFCRQQNGKKYDWLGALGVKVPFAHHEKNRWFCSEVAIAAFQQVSFMTPLDPSKYSPNELWVMAGRPGFWVRYDEWIV